MDDKKMEGGLTGIRLSTHNSGSVRVATRR